MTPAAITVAVLIGVALTTALTRWLTSTPTGRHHRPDGTSARRPLLVLSQRHYGERIAPHGRHEILPGLTEVATP